MPAIKSYFDLMAQDLFNVVASGDVQIRIDQEFALKEARAKLTNNWRLAVLPRLQFFFP